MRTDQHRIKISRYLKAFLSTMTIFLVSCVTNVDEKKYLSEMGIDLKEKYETVTSSSSSAIGDELIEFKLKVSNKDFQAIVTKIENLENFQIVAENQNPVSNYKGQNKDMEVFGWKRKDTYSYEIYKTSKSGYEFYNLTLLPDNTLTFQYSDE